MIIIRKYPILNNILCFQNHWKRIRIQSLYLQKIIRNRSKYYQNENEGLVKLETLSRCKREPRHLLGRERVEVTSCSALTWSCSRLLDACKAGQKVDCSLSNSERAYPRVPFSVCLLNPCTLDVPGDLRQ